MNWLAVLPGSPILWRIGLYALLVVSLVGYGWVKGNSHGLSKLSSFIIAQSVTSSRVVAKQEEAKTRVEIRTVEKIKFIKQKAEVQYVEIPKLVHGPCIVSNGFVRVHTAAAENSIAGPPTESDGAASSYTEADVAKVDVSTYSVLYQCRAKLGAVLDFYAELKKLRQ